MEQETSTENGALQEQARAHRWNPDAQQPDHDLTAGKGPFQAGDRLELCRAEHRFRVARLAEGVAGRGRTFTQRRGGTAGQGAPAIAALRLEAVRMQCVQMAALPRPNGAGLAAGRSCSGGIPMVSALALILVASDMGAGPSGAGDSRQNVSAETGVASPMEAHGSYRGDDWSPQRLVFNHNLETFAERVGLIVGLQSNGKLSQEQAYAQIRQLWKSLRASKDSLLEGKD
jgi:hypothetical protein